MAAIAAISLIVGGIGVANVILAIVVAVVVGVLAGLGPALQASSVEPTLALRYE